VAYIRDDGERVCWVWDYFIGMRGEEREESKIYLTQSHKAAKEDAKKRETSSEILHTNTLSTSSRHPRERGTSL
jgi:hypothetical protein